LESGYYDQVNKDRHPFFGGFKDPFSGKQYLDISYPVTTTQEDAETRAFGQIQNYIIGISSDGTTKDVKILPERPLPKQGSEPVF